MFDGEPEDKEGECNARLHIGDNYGDNHASMRCQRKPNHEGPHREVWRDGDAVVLWYGCDREEERQRQIDYYGCVLDDIEDGAERDRIMEEAWERHEAELERLEAEENDEQEEQTQAAEADQGSEKTPADGS